MPTPEMIDWTAFDHLQALIVGDVMTDRYLIGNVDRISPEAPVPVVQLRKKEARLGGAANVALNVQAMGAQAWLCSAIGNDEAADELLELMQNEGLPTQGIIRCKARKTTVKTRVMAGAQHLLRIDEETTDDITSEETQQLLGSILDILDSRQIDVIIFQDYNKGVLTPAVIDAVLQEAARRNIPTAVDPKVKNFWAYQGVTLFKPNLREIRNQYPDRIEPVLESLNEAARFIRSQIDNQLVIITLSEKGLFFSDLGEEGIIPAFPRIISDVSGAGDTVISVAALCLAQGMPPKDMALLSNIAGGQVCEKPGVITVDKAALSEEYRRRAGE
jgi:D-glycero-beta-D-manno-heptose-7-phosphate kinase